MGWKGVLRSIQAASREAERIERRYQRAVEQQQNLERKMAEYEEAARIADDYEQLVTDLVSLHRQDVSAVDWELILKSPLPNEPVRGREAEDSARAAANAYTPNLVDRLLHRVTEKRAQLEREIELSTHQDSGAYARKLAEYKQEAREWQRLHDMASGVLASDITCYVEAFRTQCSFKSIPLENPGVEFGLLDNGIAIVEVYVSPFSFIPTESITLLKSGKLSVKRIPTIKHHEIYRDYVCGCCLRVAREIHGVLPLEMLVSTCKAEVLNPQTGHLEIRALVSVAVPPDTLAKIKWDFVAPSDAMSNFVHRMDFVRGKGFRPIEPLESLDDRSVLD